MLQQQSRDTVGLCFVLIVTERAAQLVSDSKIEKVGHWGGMAISHDQRWLIYAQIDERVSDIMLAEHYR